MEQFDDRRQLLRSPVACPLDIVRLTGSGFNGEGMMIESCSEGASFCSPLRLGKGEIITLRYRSRAIGKLAPADYEPDPPPFQTVTSEVIYCCRSEDDPFRFKIGVRHLLAFF
jgi:hypothetical protein